MRHTTWKGLRYPFLTLFFLMAGPASGPAIQFSNEFITWRSYIAEYKEYLFRGDDGKFHNFSPPEDWQFQAVSASEARLQPDYELSSIVLTIDRTGEFPDFDTEKDLKHYAQILVRNLPPEAENRGEIKLVGGWLYYSNWKTTSLKVDYTLHGNRMTLAMGFCNDPDHPEYQLRWKINCLDRHFDDIREDMNRPWSAWGEMSRQRAEELDSSEVIID